MVKCIRHITLCGLCRCYSLVLKISLKDYSLKEMALQILRLPIDVIKRFRTDRLTRHAAALSFSSMLALAPMAAIGFAVLSTFASFEQLSIELENFIYQFLVPTAGEELRQYIDQFASQIGKLTLFGSAFFLLTALLLLFNIEESFNDIWRVHKGRPLVSRLTVYWALITLGPFLMGASLTLSTYFLSLQLLGNSGVFAQVRSVGTWMLPFALQLVAFLLLYLVMPNVTVKLRHAFIGALVASLLFDLTKKGFAFYIVNLKSYQIVYGALSTLPIFLIWIYLSWVIALIGAEVVAVMQERYVAKHKLESEGVT